MSARVGSAGAGSPDAEETLEVRPEMSLLRSLVTETLLLAVVLVGVASVAHGAAAVGNAVGPAEAACGGELGDAALEYEGVSATGATVTLAGTDADCRVRVVLTVVGQDGGTVATTTRQAVTEAGRTTLTVDLDNPIELSAVGSLRVSIQPV